MSEHEAEGMAESFPPGSEHEERSAEGNTFGADPHAAMQRPQPDDAPPAGSDPSFPGGDSADKLDGPVPGHQGDETSQDLRE